MKYPPNFEFWVGEDRVRVRFVSQKTLGSIADGHASRGEYKNRIIRLFRGELPHALQAVFLHELGHYLYERGELKSPTEEDAADLLTWLPTIVHDKRNGALRRFLRIREA